MDEDLLGALGIEFSYSALAAGLIFGIVGMWLFRRARKANNTKVVMLSIALMVYPYFTHGPWQDWGIGFLLCGLCYWLW